MKVQTIAHITQGRKGQAHQRINMAFLPDNIEYLRRISRLEGVSQTDYVNTLIEKDMMSRGNIVNFTKSILKEG